MKVVFVASGNKTGGDVSPFVRSQFESLKSAGLDMRLLPVKGHGVNSYLKAAWRLRRLVRQEHPDVIHAHYSVCGHVAMLATLGMWHRPKIVVSILGSFPERKRRKLQLVRFCINHIWDKTLVKSRRTMIQLGIDLPIIPNGVNLNVFRPESHVKCREKVGFEEGKRYVIWCSHPTRPEKNWLLAQAAVEKVKSKVGGVELIAVYDKTPDEVSTYMNAAECLLLTSWSEGSPNVVKEAMACNCPIVTTDVGDVNERLCGLDGCYVAKTEHPIVNNETFANYVEENAQTIAECLAKVLNHPIRTKGKERIIQDGLTIELTAKKIIEWYE